MTPNELLTSSFRTGYSGPILVMNRASIISNVEDFRRGMSRVEINYAVKANPHITVIQTLMSRTDVSFEVASAQEIGILDQANIRNQAAGLPAFDFKRVLYSNPVRPMSYIKEAHRMGIDWFVVDSTLEIDKVMRVNPLANLYLRLIVPNDDSTFPLTGKFGVDWRGACSIIDHCRERMARLRGITFHVGSQCPNIQNWVKGIHLAKEVFKEMRRQGFIPTFLDLGGGYPVQHTTPIPSIFDIGDQINDAIRDFDHSIRIVAEPGRFIVSNAGHLLCQVISRSIRDGKPWIYLDAGVFHGMTEASVGDFKLVYITEKGGELVETAIAGPTCDSLDIVTKSQLLPAKLREGDFVVLQNTGAYTSTYSTNFNGFPPVRVEFSD